MASTSHSRPAGAGRFKSAATTLFNENQSLNAEFRKAMNMMKEVAIDSERHNQTEMVKELEKAVLELLETSEDSSHLSAAIQSVGENYQPGENLTDFHKLFEDEITKSKRSSPSAPQNHPFLRQFRGAVWALISAHRVVSFYFPHLCCIKNVHHAGELMPGEDQEDIVMTSTQCNILNINCPLSGKPVTELREPVRSLDCKHIYEKNALMQFIGTNMNVQCPVAACPKNVVAARVVCDGVLLADIDELRASNKDSARPNAVEDFTRGNDEEESDDED